MKIVNLLITFYFNVDIRKRVTVCKLIKDRVRVFYFNYYYLIFIQNHSNFKF